MVYFDWIDLSLYLSWNQNNIKQSKYLMYLNQSISSIKDICIGGYFRLEKSMTLLLSLKNYQLNKNTGTRPKNCWGIRKIWNIKCALETK